MRIAASVMDRRLGLGLAQSRDHARTQNDEGHETCELSWSLDQPLAQPLAHTCAQKDEDHESRKLSWSPRCRRERPRRHSYPPPHEARYLEHSVTRPVAQHASFCGAGSKHSLGALFEHKAHRYGRYFERPHSTGRLLT